MSEYFLFKICTDDAIGYENNDKEISSKFKELCQKSQVVLFCVTKPYVKAPLCIEQIKYAVATNKRIIIFIMDEIKIQDFLKLLQLKTDIPPLYDFFLNSRALVTWTGPEIEAFVEQLKTYLAEFNPYISFE